MDIQLLFQIGLILWSVAAAVVRLTPTKKDNKWFSLFNPLVILLLKDKKIGGGYHD